MKRLFVPTALAAIAMTAFSSCNNVMKIKHLPYPETERGDVVDNYFGTEVADPYRWLEDDRSEATAAWVEAENAVTEDYLAQIPFRDAIRERLTQLWNYPKESAPTKKGDWFYFSRNDGLQNQSVIYRRATPEAEALLLEGRPLSGLCRSGIGLGLGRDTRGGYRHGTADRRPHQLGEEFRGAVGSRLRRFLLQRL